LPNDDATAGKWLLAPWMIVDAGIDASRLMGSSTSKREGIVSNVDFAPSVLRYFGLPVHDSMIGFTVERIAAPDGYAQLMKELRDIRTVYELRPKVLYSF